MYTPATLMVMSFTLPAVIVIAIGLYFLLRKKSSKIRLIPFQVLAVIILVMEVAKQILGLTIVTYDL
ncbi:MAG: hypothetical protein FWE53_03165 [Firmicutes bacterium]|nr:hypothetical protein [Bacillota bacterium]